jgi:hypothetical protein
VLLALSTPAMSLRLCRPTEGLGRPAPEPETAFSSVRASPHLRLSERGPRSTELGAGRARITRAAPPARRQPRPADPLAGLAAEVGRASEPWIDLSAGPREPRESPRQRDNAREMTAQREPMRPRGNARERDRDPVREREAAREREPGREPPRIREPQPPPVAAEAPFDADADQNLTDMAQRLEAALRRPGKAGEPRPADSAPRAARANAESTSPWPARGPAPAEAKPARSLYDSLENEMASLLGSPAESASRAKVRHADLGQPPPAAAARPASDE